MLVAAVVRYRTLLGKCELGVGLDWDEIEQLTAIEAVFAPSADDRRTREARRFRRAITRATALLRGDRINDRVELIEIAPGGFVVRGAPFIARGEQVELTVDEGDRSYRFRARGAWVRDDGEDYRVGLELLGMPVALRKVAVSAHQADVVDRIAAAA